MINPNAAHSYVDALTNPSARRYASLYLQSLTVNQPISTNYIFSLSEIEREQIRRGIDALVTVEQTTSLEKKNDTE